MDLRNRAVTKREVGFVMIVTLATCGVLFFPFFLHEGSFFKKPLIALSIQIVFFILLWRVDGWLSRTFRVFEDRRADVESKD